MTDHNREEREAVIESAWAMTPDEIAQHPYAAMDKMRWLARELRSVFEQAHTPTIDEREALANLIDDELQSQRIFDLRDMASAILAAGFRRAVQGEPTDAAEGTGQPTNHEGAR